MRDIRVITPDDLGDGIVWNEQTKKYEVSQNGGSSYPAAVGLRMKEGGTALAIGLDAVPSLNISVCGMIFENTRGCLCGMRDNSNVAATRMSMRLLGVSKKVQWQVEGTNTEIYQGDEFPTLDQDLFEPRIWNYNRQLLQCTDLQGNIRGQTTMYRPRANISYIPTNLNLFGDVTQDTDFINCVIWWVKTTSYEGILQRHLVPNYKDGVWGFLDIVNVGDFYGSEFLEPYQLG